MEALEQLKEKLSALLKKHAAIKAENKRLQGIVDDMTQKNIAMTQKIATLEQGLVSVRFDGVPVSDEDKQNMRQQLDSVISEIDKMLSNLND